MFTVRVESCPKLHQILDVFVLSNFGVQVPPNLYPNYALLIARHVEKFVVLMLLLPKI